MSTTTTTPATTAEALAELDAATADVATAEAAVQDVTAAVEAGKVTDPEAIVQADSRRRFSLLRRKGAAARLEAARAAEQAAALDALSGAVDGFKGTVRIRTAEDTFAAAVQAAATAYAGTVAEVDADAVLVIRQARAAGVPNASPADGMDTWFLYGSRLYRNHGTSPAVDTPMPAKHPSTLRALDKRATTATRSGVQGGAR